MRKLLHGIAIAAVLALGACASQGIAEMVPATYPDGEKITIVAHDQSVPDWMLDRDTLKINYIVRGDVTEKQLAAVAETERACRVYTKIVRPNNLVIVVANGALYSVAGFLGVGFGSQAFTATKFSEYALYGAAATGTAGAANGVISLGGQTYTFENCSREALGAVSQYGVRVLTKSPN